MEQCHVKTTIDKGTRPFCPSFDACCRAAHINAICSSCWTGCVLAANKPLQGFEWNRAQTTSLRRSQLGCFAPLQTAIFTYVQTNQTKWETPPFVSEQRLQSRCEKHPECKDLVMSFCCAFITAKRNLQLRGFYCYPFQI